jgi:hypothetical protein
MSSEKTSRSCSPSGSLTKEEHEQNERIALEYLRKTIADFDAARAPKPVDEDKEASSSEILFNILTHRRVRGQSSLVSQRVSRATPPPAVPSAPKLRPTFNFDRRRSRAESVLTAESAAGGVKLTADEPVELHASPRKGLQLGPSISKDQEQYQSQLTAVCPNFLPYVLVLPTNPAISLN